MSQKDQSKLIFVRKYTEPRIWIKVDIHRISYEIEDENDIPDLKVKFDQPAVQALLKVGEYESIMITGQLTDGSWLGWEDRISVIKVAD